MIPCSDGLVNLERTWCVIAHASSYMEKNEAGHPYCISWTMLRARQVMSKEAQGSSSALT